jgi:TIR domain
MEFEIFKKRALTKLVGLQEDDGSWNGDIVATISAVETLCEQYGGPDTFSKFSVVGAALHSAKPGGLLRFSWGAGRDGKPSMHTDDPDIGYVAAIYRGVVFGWKMVPWDDPIDETRAWLRAKWLRVNSVFDTDFSIGRYSSLHGLSTREAWLLALMFHTEIHRQYSVEDCSSLISIIEELTSLMKDDHWESRKITAEEATAIVGSCLFHESTLFISHLNDRKTYSLQDRARKWLASKQSSVPKSKAGKIDLPSLRDRVLKWVVNKQSPSGNWADSVHVTAHCLKLLDTALVGVQADHPQYRNWMEALGRGTRYVLQPDIQSQWCALSSYQQIDVLLVLTRMSKRPLLAEAIFNGLQVDGSAFEPDVFISYGTPDKDFARRLSKDLESEGLRTWFAEWDLDYGDNIVQEIETGLDSTKSFIIILSPEAIQRRWVKQELSAAFHQALGGPGKLIVPLMLKQCQPPPFLAAHRYIDFTNPGEYSHQVQSLARRLKGRPTPRQ